MVQLYNQIRIYFERNGWLMPLLRHRKTKPLGWGRQKKGYGENECPLRPRFSAAAIFRIVPCEGAAICKLTDFVCKISKIVEPISFVIFQNFRYSSARFKQ